MGWTVEKDGSDAGEPSARPEPDPAGTGGPSGPLSGPDGVDGSGRR